MGDLVSLQDSSRIGIHYKNRTLPCVQQYRIGCLRANPVDCQKLAAQLLSWRAEHLCQRTCVEGLQKSHKVLQLPRFLPKIAGRADERPKIFDPRFGNGRRPKQCLSPQGEYSALYVPPTGILRQDRTHDNFKPGSPGPPFLWPAHSKKKIEIFFEYGQHPLTRPNRPHARIPDGRRFTMWGNGQRRVHLRLFRKIDSPARQVKNPPLSAVTKPWPGGQVLANSQRWFKIELHRNPAFAMLTVGSPNRGSPADVCPFR